MTTMFHRVAFVSIVIAATLATLCCAMPIKSRGSLADVQAKYNAWKASFVVVNGDEARVRRPENGDDSVSEGLAYGMVLAVHFDERTLFTKMWNYVQGAGRLNANGLMNWRISASGSVLGANSATDAELDFAYALLVAVRVRGWCEFSDAADTLVRKIMAHEVDSAWVLKPGDVWGGAGLTNPSYFAPAYYEIFRQHTGNQDWAKVIGTTYATLSSINNLNGGTGLVPDWCDKDGKPTSGMGYDYKYDACRTPWRVGMDAWWFDRTAAKSYCDDIVAFFGSPSSIGDAYTITGSKYSNNNNAAFVGPAACCMAVAGTDAQADVYWDWMKSAGPSAYFQDSLGVMTMLMITGLMINPLDGNQCVAGSTGTVTSASPSAPAASPSASRTPNPSASRTPNPSASVGSSSSSTSSGSATPTRAPAQGDVSASEEPRPSVDGQSASPTREPIAVSPSSHPHGHASPSNTPSPSKAHDDMIVVIIIVDMRAWNNTRKLAAMGHKIVAQLAVAAGVPLNQLDVRTYQLDDQPQRAHIAVFATTEQQASALYTVLNSDNSGAGLTESNGILSASLVSETSQEAQAANNDDDSDDTVNVALIVGVVVGCVLLALVLGVVVLIAVLMVLKHVLKQSPYPASSDSKVELNASNIMYSRNSL